MRAAEHAKASVPSSSARVIAGRYRAEAALGRGGSAQVYKVTDLSSGGELALKRLNPNASRRLTQLFELEYRTLASLDHPGTVEVFEYGHDGDTAFYTMELLHGQDLKARAPMPWREALGYLRDAAQALGLLHARKLIHRDVSPRNLWRTEAGRVKLIDFGALLPFGRSDHLMGTPPLIAPEAVRGEALDQRADIYSLGATAYYLMTGEHAFPAREFSDLPPVWARGATPLSARVAGLREPGLDPIPPELDQLVAAMLSQHVLARPSNAPELIDRIDALLGHARPSQSDLAELHLTNSAFVGRVAARRTLRRQLRVAASGRRGQSAILEGEAGQGRSRLLKELALEARVLPATVLHVQAAKYNELYGVAAALGLKLLEALPEAAKAAAQPHADLLACASPRLSERLGVSTTCTPDTIELRVRIQAAFRDWFLQVAKEHALVVLIDGLEQLDDGSGAFVLALALARRHTRLFLVATLLKTREPSAVARGLLKTSMRRQLSGLSETETFELLHSVFGSAEHLGRLARRLLRVTHGNPGHVLELCAQLVRDNRIGFSHGSWLLPQEVSPTDLSSTREQALGKRLSRLSTGARQLARALSMNAGVLDDELTRALAATVSEQALVQLSALLSEEILVRDDKGVSFAHESLRKQLLAELTPQQRSAAQRAIGRYLLARPRVSELERLNAGIHLLGSGDARGAELIVNAAQYFALTATGELAVAAPLLEEALPLLRAHGSPKAQEVSLLAALAMSGYYVERRYAQLYGDDALSALSDLAGLSLARRLQTMWGGKLGLLIGLALASARRLLQRAKHGGPRQSDALLMLFSCVGALTGSAAVCLDPASAQRYTDVLAPFAVLGKKHIASFVHEYCGALTATLRDAWGAALEHWQQIIERLDRRAIKALPEVQRQRFMGGALFASGVLQAQGDGPEALRIADRLEQNGLAIDRMSADQVRTVFYAHQGDAKRFAEYAERVEQHAVQQGSSWQVETWFASSSSAVDLRTHDLMGMKQASEQLQRLSQTIPSLDLAARRARGGYLMMRKKYAEALPWLEECLREEAQSSAGWSCMHGVLARTYNRLGDFERARTTCMRALQLLTPGDFALTGLYLVVQTEMLVAEAGLGRAADAQVALEGLIAQHEPQQGPLTMGQLHEAGVDIALIARDEGAAQYHLEQTKRWYLPTGTASLVQRCAILSARVRPPKGSQVTAMPTASPSAMPSMISGDRSTVSHTVDRMLSGGALSLRELSHKALQILAEHTRAARGFLYTFDARDHLVLQATLLDEREPGDLRAWILLRLASDLEPEHTDGEGDGEESTRALQVMRDGSDSYRMLPLAVDLEGGIARIVAVAIVGTRGGVPSECPHEIASAVAGHLSRAQAREQPAP